MLDFAFVAAESKGLGSGAANETEGSEEVIGVGDEVVPSFDEDESVVVSFEVEGAREVVAGRFPVEERDIVCFIKVIVLLDLFGQEFERRDAAEVAEGTDTENLERFAEEAEHAVAEECVRLGAVSVNTTDFQAKTISFAR